jgi:hypothetical protein
MRWFILFIDEEINVEEKKEDIFKVLLPKPNYVSDDRNLRTNKSF